MADSNFRSYRSHDPLARPGDRAPASAQIADPLAELARLIGQTGAADGFGRGAAGATDPAAYEPEPAASPDWAADDRYAEAAEPARETYGAGYEEETVRYEEEFVAPPREQSPAPRLNGGRDDSRRYATPQPRVRDEVAPAQEFKIPAFLPRGGDDRYEYEDEEQSGSDDQAYAADDYEDEAPSPRRRSGLVLVAAILGLAVLGTAGAFAYRSMFGGSMLPSLPPIIKADTGPTKIMPNAGSAQGSASDQAGASGNGSAEKLVSREEKPVDVPPPVSAAPRVVSTIPIFPAPGSQSGGPNAVTPNVPVPVQSAPPPANAPAVPLAAAAPPYAPVASAEPKKIHTVAIRPDQSGGLDAMPATVTPPAVAPAPASAPARATPPPRPAPVAARPAPAPVPQAANAPLSILPGQADRPVAPPPRTRTALVEPTPLSPSAAAEAPSAPGGGYAVQVTSQRSEADAQTAFRALRAKYPTQLGGHEPIVRRADLGTKGVFYRALVGPFASMEQAAGVCSSLKAAGGTCIVQRN
ncbi:MAG: SPOR domain-containing protein [Xanthobacteraceae bacterium]